MSQKFTVLFDLDGTLINTAPDLMDAHNYVMRKYGYIESDINEIKKIAGRGSKIMIRKSVGELKDLKKYNEKIEEEMTKEFINYYSKKIYNKSKIIDGVINFLNWCKEKNFLMAVCTNKQEHLSIDLLKKANIYNFFDYVAGGNTFSYNKPDPRHLTSTIEIIGGDLKKTIMIGDSETDANAAKSASIPFILIDNGYTEKKTDEIYHNHLSQNFNDLEKTVLKYIND